MSDDDQPLTVERVLLVVEAVASFAIAYIILLENHHCVLACGSDEPGLASRLVSWLFSGLIVTIFMMTSVKWLRERAWGQVKSYVLAWCIVLPTGFLFYWAMLALLTRLAK